MVKRGLIATWAARGTRPLLGVSGMDEFDDSFWGVSWNLDELSDSSFFPFCIWGYGLVEWPLSRLMTKGVSNGTVLSEGPPPQNEGGSP